MHKPLIPDNLISNYIVDDTADNLKSNVYDLLSSMERLRLPSYTNIVFIGFSFGSMIIKEVSGLSFILLPVQNHQVFQNLTTLRQ